MGIRTSNRAYRGSTGVAGASLDSVIKSNISAKIFSPTLAQKVVFMNVDEYQKMLDNLGQSGIFVEAKEQKALLKDFNAATTEMKNLHSDISEYIKLIQDNQGTQKPNKKVSDTIITVEKNILNALSRVTSGNSFMDLLSKQDIYDIQPVLNLHTDLDNLQTIVEKLDVDFKLNNANLSVLLGQINSNLKKSIELINNYEDITNKALTSGKTHFLPEGNVGWYDKTSDKYYINTDGILNKIEVDSVKNLLSLKDNEEEKQEFFRIVADAINPN